MNHKRIAAAAVSLVLGGLAAAPAGAVTLTFGELAMLTPERGFYTLLMEYPAFPVVAGIATPTSSSSAASSSTPSPKASRLTASTSAPISRPRSRSSIRRNKAAIARIELVR